ncbi:MAG: DUF4296 domain-containing protein [Bacteroidetes bacterium]|jgi:Domain of unknown function (DUF4296)|nr:DUF4296 domain-containing protein [Bacteroidota bacterium]
MIKPTSFVFVVLCFLALACTSTPKNVLPVNTMKVVMFDMLKADDWYARIIVGDTLMKKVKEDIPLYEQVFAVHKLTKKEFFDSYHYYESHPVAYKELVDSLESYAINQKLKTLKK